MKMYSDCSGPCCTCAHSGHCVAGHGNDEYDIATIAKVKDNVRRGSYPYDNDIGIMLEFLNGNGVSDEEINSLLHERELSIAVKRGI